MLKLGELLKSNIWINANAGSGKTTVLIKRFLVFLLNNYSHNEILCITYTKVAANEMKTRIIEKLKEWNSSDDDLLSYELKELYLENFAINKEKFITKAKNLLNEINDSEKDFKIMTIHSFCYEILKKHSVELNIDNNVQILTNEKNIEIVDLIKYQVLFEQSEEFKVKYQLLFDSLNFLNQNTTSLYLNYVIEDSISNTNKLSKLFEDNIKINNDLFNPMKLLPDEIFNVMPEELKENFTFEFADEYCENLKKTFFNYIKSIDSLYFLLQDIKKKNRYFQDNEIDEIMTLDYNNSQLWSGLKNAIYTSNNDIRAAVTKITDENTVNFISQIIMFFNQFWKMKEILISIHSVSLSYNVVKIYQEYKLKNKYITYDDILHLTLKLIKS